MCLIDSVYIVCYHWYEHVKVNSAKYLEEDVITL